MAQKAKGADAKPVVRFAPSPTGFLHIGGARTALFNWLYARHTGGRYLLRIEDTDRERNSPAAVEAILDGLKWLELDWEGEAVSQFARAGRHREVAAELLARGNAYNCYSPKEEVDAARELAKAEGRPQIFHSPWRDRKPEDAPKGVKPAVRLKAPREGETIVDDVVQGRTTFPNKDLDDLIILRSDGNPTYNLAVVVDDHDMGVTHVIRGVDHLTNAGRQSQIYARHGLGYSRLRARAVDPRSGRRQTLQAPRRAGRRGLPRHGLPAGRTCATISYAWAGATATTRSSRRRS